MPPRSVFWPLFVAATACLCLAQTASQVLLHGIITTKDGGPVAGVVVYPSEQRECCANRAERTTSDDVGSFHLTNPPKVVHFFKDGLAPASRVIGPEDKEIKVVLEEDASTRWLLPPCTGKEHGRRVGWPYQFLLPRGAKVQKRFDNNNVSYVVSDRSREYSLVIWTGPVVGGLDADDDWLVNAASFTERSVRDGTRFAGQDFRGTDKAGRPWRWTGLSGYNVARYRRVPDETANFFDSIINSACVLSDAAGK